MKNIQMEASLVNSQNSADVWVRLAKAKIATALLDLATTSKRSEYVSDKIQSEIWIFNKSSDFVLWCDTAGFDPYYIRTKAKDILKNGLNHRAKATKAKNYIIKKFYRDRSKNNEKNRA